MSQAPTPDSSWKGLPSWLFFAFLVVGPPTVLVAFARTVTQNPILVVLIIAGYEVLLFMLRFTGKIWGRLEDPLSEHIAKWFAIRTQEIISHSYQRYCQCLIAENEAFDVKGLSTRTAHDLELEQVFVDLRIRPLPAHQVSADPLSLPDSLQGSHSIWKYLSSTSLANPHLVILGAPGSGKTTLLKHLALTLAQPRKYPQRRLHSHRLPILLFLRDHIQAISEQPDFSLEHAVQNHSKQHWQQTLLITWVSRRLKKGACIVLLDGLDEVADQSTRRKVVDWVQRQLIAYGHNRFVLTSRPYGYRENPLSGVTVLDVQAFTSSQIENFAQNWYFANELKSWGKESQGVQLRAREGTQDLLRRLHRVPALLVLAVNPLLLTMIATVHRYRSSLPGKRVELYDEICEVFLGKRQEARGIEQELSPAQKQQVLQPLAYFLMEHGMREISYTEVQRVIAPALALVSPQMEPADFLKLVENTSGLFLERNPGSYGFAHLTFQEYLAAVHIKEEGLEKILVAQVTKTWWHETIRLYCAQSDATALVQACLARNPPTITALTLAFECDEEKLKIQPQAQAQINALLEAGGEDPNSERRRVIVGAFLTRRLRQMVHLRQGTYIDTSLVTCAEYQVFLDEQRAQGKYYQPDHWTDFSFIAGSGNLPVLGVRRSDAQAFCQWLTARDEGRWLYRLPRAEEWLLDERMGESKLSAETGYWVESEPPFVWSKGEPSRNLQEQFSYSLDYAHGRVRSHASDLDLAQDHDPTRARARARDRALDRAHTRALTLDLDLDLDRARAHDLTGDLAINLELILARVRARVRARDHDLDYALNLSLDRALDYTSDRDRDRDLDLCYMLIILEERIAGNLPACEGILLVKESVSKAE